MRDLAKSQFCTDLLYISRVPEKKKRKTCKPTGIDHIPLASGEKKTGKLATRMNAKSS